LHWNAPPECPTGEQVMQDARTLAKRRGAIQPTASTVVDAVVERQAEGRWGLTLAIGSAKQHVAASSCAQLARAGALFVALILDSSSGQVASEGEPPRAASDAPTPPAQEPARAPAPEPLIPVRRAGREVSLLIGAGLGIDVGTLPRAEPLGTFEVGIRYRRVEASVQGSAGPAQDEIRPGGAGVRLRPVSALFTPCYAPFVTGHLRLGPCARAEVGWLHAQALGVSNGRSVNSAWLACGAELASWLVLGEHFEARLGAGVLVPIERPNFLLTGIGGVFEPGVALRTELAALLRF
jgi:hypothetical protein